MFRTAEFQRTLFSSLLICLAILLVYWIGIQMPIDFGSWGISPGNKSHVAGIFLAPLAHANAGHLLSNVSSLFILLLFLGSFYYRFFYTVFSLSWVLTGLMMFLFARSGFSHIGASGVVYAIIAFLIFAGFLSGDRARKTVSLILILFYGSMFWGIFPLDPKVSWDGHLSGLAVGLALAFVFRKGYKKDIKTELPEWYDSIDEPSEDPYRHFHDKD